MRAPRTGAPLRSAFTTSESRSAGTTVSTRSSGTRSSRPALADRGRRVATTEERPRPERVPRAALVVADPPCPGGKDGVAGRVERRLGHEPDELDRLGHKRLLTSRSMEDLELVSLRVEEVRRGAPLRTVDSRDVDARRPEPLDGGVHVVDAKGDDDSVPPRERKVAALSEVSVVEELDRPTVARASWAQFTPGVCPGPGSTSVSSRPRTSR